MLEFEESNPYIKLLKKISLYDLKTHVRQNKQFLKNHNQGESVCVLNQLLEF